MHLHLNLVRLVFDEGENLRRLFLLACANEHFALLLVFIIDLHFVFIVVSLIIGLVS